MADVVEAPAEAPEEVKEDGKLASESNKASTAKPSKPISNGTPVMRVRVASPFKVFFDDEAVSLSGVNGKGPFDILPHHHHFISLLSECDLAVVTRTGTTNIKISGGIMHGKEDKVLIFLNV